MNTLIWLIFGGPKEQKIGIFHIFKDTSSYFIFFWKYNSEKFNYKVREYKVTFSSNDFFVPNNKFKAIQYSLKIKSVNFPTIKLTTVL